MQKFLKLTSEQVFPPLGRAILVSCSPNKLYDDQGKPTDRVDGIRADVRALPDLSPVTVKVLGASAPMSNDELERLNLQARFVWVEFESLVANPWTDRRSGELRISATATGIKITDASCADDYDLDLG